MGEKFKLNVGDIFTIPLGNEEFGIGQIVWFPNHKHNFIMVVFKEKFQDIEKLYLTEINSFEILFLGYTVDAKLYNKKWKVIDNITSNLSNIQMPYYKLGLSNDGARLVDYKGDTLLNINEGTFNKLNYQTEVGPVRFENALKAYFGIKEWIAEDYDKILYEKVLESIKVAETVLSK